MSSLFWMHDDWLLIFFEPNKQLFTYFVVEMAPEWLAHDCGVSNCEDCEAIWVELAYKYASCARTRFSSGMGKPFAELFLGDDEEKIAQTLARNPIAA